MSQPAQSPTTHKLVCFLLAGQEFAAPIREVKETIALRPLTRVFLVPPFVAGLMNLRGEVVAVLDLFELLGFAPRSLHGEVDRRRNPDAAIVILRPPEALGARAANRAAAGLLVDRMIGVRDVPLESLQPAPPTLSSEAASYLRGVATVDDPPRPLLCLDLEKVLTTERLRPFRRETHSGDRP